MMIIQLCLGVALLAAAQADYDAPVYPYPVDPYYKPLPVPYPKKKIVTPYPKKKIIVPYPKKKIVYPGKKIVYPKKPAYIPGGNGAKKVGGHGYFPNNGALYGGKGGYGKGGYGYGKGPYYKKVMHANPLTPTGGCPHGWLPYGGMCYLFSRDQLGWFEASMKCMYMGGYLAVANSAHENSYLKLMAGKYNTKPGVWIGLNDVLFPKSHMWLWGYGKKQCKWFDWGPKEPKYKGPGYKHCVALWCNYDWQWKVHNCYSKMYYICELNPRKICKCGY